ncbi:hypothetical protein V5799_023599 [Amblyomma americanum]|uniref:C2H2-type domain-containing protein n=1 Tax=Amblyomma americanum TaxID=6943 RepID=A0AAQ4FIM4_AMBAM
MEGQSAPPADSPHHEQNHGFSSYSESIVTENFVCDVCSVTVCSLPQLMQHLTGKRHKALVTALKLAVMRLPPNLRPPQLRMLPQKNGIVLCWGVSKLTYLYYRHRRPVMLNILPWDMSVLLFF